MFTFLSKDRLEYAITTLWVKIKNTFALKSHTHTKSQISDFPTSMPADGGNADTVNGFTVGVNVPADAEFHYTLPAANNTTLGGIQLGFTQTGKKYPVVTSSQKAYVEVPWVNTTYGVVNSDTDGLMSSEDKTKLDGIESGANKYVLPNASKSAYGGVKVGDNIAVSNGVISLTKGGITNALGYTPPTQDTTYDLVTTTTDGLMSSEDKTKLNGIATGANKYVLPNATASTLGGVKIGSNITISSGVISLTKANVTNALGYTPPTTNTTYTNATTSSDGLMSSEDKTKLNGIAEGANKTTINNTLTSTSTTQALSAAQGKSLNDRIVAIQNKLAQYEAGTVDIMVEVTD